MTAPSLFSFDFSENAFQPGEIVRQAWPWILCELGRSLMPFWQVHHIHVEGGRRLIYCRPVPFTTGGGQLHAFSEHDLERTGQSWRVPSYHEVDTWLKDLGTSSFHVNINGRPPTTTHPDEAELVALVQSLGPVRLPYSERVFYEHFPHPTREEWRTQKRGNLT